MTVTLTARVDRRTFVADLIAEIPDALVVSGLGSSSYDLFAAGDRDLNFYLWGAMGAAASVGLGLAVAQPDRSVVVITGDGEQLMGLGALASIGAAKPVNLTVVVLDNGHFGETGMQPSHAALGTDLGAVAQAVGIQNVVRITEDADVADLAKHVNGRTGPVLAHVLIEADEPPRALPPRDGVHVKNRFRHALGLAPF